MGLRPGCVLWCNRINGNSVLAASSLANALPRGSSNCAQIVAQLLLVTGSDDHICDCGPLKQPVESNLRNGLAGSFEPLRGVHNAVQNSSANLRTKFAVL